MKPWRWIRPGEKVPTWGGIALVWSSGDGLILPIGLNVLVGLVWRLWLLAKIGAATRSAYAQLDRLAKLQVEREQLEREIGWLRKRTG